MKLATFLDGHGAAHVGSVEADGVLVDLSEGDTSGLLGSMLDLIEGGERAMTAAREAAAARKQVYALDSVQLLAPIPRPPRIRDYLCFEQHVRQARANRYLYGLAPAPIDPASIELSKVWYDRPVCYKCNTFNVVGDGAQVRWPSYSRIIDYELEMALVIGKPGCNVPAAKAREHVFGYTIFNDFSARDEQNEEMQVNLGASKSKDFDTGNAFGPWIVTADEIVDPHALEMTARVNGEEWSRGNSSAMHHSFDAVIAQASRDESLVAGEILCSGTVGNGSGTEIGRFMKDGDVIELEISGIGVLSNTIVAPHVKTVPRLPIQVFR